MSLRDKLSAKEKKMIEYYIDRNASDESSRVADVDHILRLWDREKSKAISNLFGGELMITQPVTFKQDVEETSQEIQHAVMTNDDAKEFLTMWRQKFGWTPIWGEDPLTEVEMDEDAKYSVYCLGDYVRLASNRWDGETFAVPFPDGTIFKVQHGTKITKAMGKIARAFNLPEEKFEAFRIACSQGLNQKEIKGNLTLSIHPLDYMTMSDNNCDWGSCMSWEDRGCYRQGTVEMMNSPMVVVAYIAAEDRMFRLHQDFEWNSKKWRELFIVTPDIICNILGYPYRNSNLSLATINILKELAEKNLGWTYGNKEAVVWKQHEPFNPFNDDEDFDIEVRTDTNNMYNDFSDRDHFGFFGKDIDSGILKVYYSGPSECMLCGMEDPELEEESYLAGTCCEEILYCDCCGERIHRDDSTYEIDGMMLCSYCADDRVRMDSIYQEDHYDENLREITLLNDSNYTTTAQVYIYYDDFDWSQMKKYFKRILGYRRYKWGSYSWYVHQTDLTPEGKELFCGEEGYTDFELMIEDKFNYRWGTFIEPQNIKEFSPDLELVRW